MFFPLDLVIANPGLSFVGRRVVHGLRHHLTRDGSLPARRSEASRS